MNRRAIFECPFGTKRSGERRHDGGHTSQREWQAGVCGQRHSRTVPVTNNDCHERQLSGAVKMMWFPVNSQILSTEYERAHHVFFWSFCSRF